MRKVLGLVIVALAIAAAVFAYRAGWLPARAAVRGASSDPGTPPANAVAAPAGSAPAVAQPETATVPPNVNLVALDMGGHVESVTSEHSGDSYAWHLIDHRPGSESFWSSVAGATYPQDITFSFMAQEPAFVSAVIVNNSTRDYPSERAKDIEIWISTESPTSGFIKAGGLTLREDPVEQTVAFEPVQARFVRLRILSNYGGGIISVGKVKVIEAQHEGYTPLLARHPDLAVLLAAPVLQASATGSSSPAGAITTPPLDACGPQAPPVAPAREESRNVLVITPGKRYPPMLYKPADLAQRPPDPYKDFSIYSRLKFTVVKPAEATLLMLLPAGGIDTVVLGEVCDIKTSLSDPFKKGLVNWVAQGHKLIIQDSDACGPRAEPDYSFLPYRLVTSNPGARGDKGDLLLFAEENTLATSNPEAPSFLDLPDWQLVHRTDLGDSNLIVEHDPHWCGHLFGTNVLKKNGFMEAYTHYGKGLIIYDGFDVDDPASPDYRQLVTRELAQPFDPDNLSCSARLGDFVLTTEQRVKDLPMVPGRVYSYPLTLLSNQGYSGTIKLSLAAAPADPGFTYRFEPDVVELTEISKATLTVTTTRESSPTRHTLSVRGTDVAAKSNAVCLALNERKTGGIQVVSARPPNTKSSKNLEIILDVSGSMKLALGGKTRWATALDVLKSVVEKLPDDFNVGLRVYAHRYPAASRETCTDTELVVPIDKLDRSRIGAAVRQLKPRGETPLVYSILQAPGDLKARGGGSVVVITDGEDTCKGDPVSAARQLKASGLDVTLNIVGFTLKGKAVQDQLTTLAESTGGRYYGAQSGEALARALWNATVDRFPFTIFDATGKQVAKGDAGASPVELEPGEYRVVVKVADQELTDQVVVTSGGDVVLRVSLKGDKFVIER